MMRETLARLGRMHQFAALRHRDFRLLWIASVFSSSARWADLVVVGWLTLELTDSPLMVGIVAASKMAGYLAAPFMGVIADRMDRRLLLIVAAVVNLAVSVIMLLLFASGWIALWHIIALALVGSLTWALDNPTRQAFVPDLVPREYLTNARWPRAVEKLPNMRVWSGRENEADPVRQCAQLQAACRRVNNRPHLTREPASG